MEELEAREALAAHALLRQKKARPPLPPLCVCACLRACVMCVCVLCEFVCACALVFVCACVSV